MLSVAEPSFDADEKAALGEVIDSGWVSVAAGTHTSFRHDIGGDPDDYVVDVQFRDDGGNAHIYGLGLYQTRSGDRVGAYWNSLTDTNVYVYRSQDDGLCEEARIRIWVIR